MKGEELGIFVVSFFFKVRASLCSPDLFQIHNQDSASILLALRMCTLYLVNGNGSILDPVQVILGFVPLYIRCSKHHICGVRSLTMILSCTFPRNPDMNQGPGAIRMSIYLGISSEP